MQFAPQRRALFFHAAHRNHHNRDALTAGHAIPVGVQGIDHAAPIQVGHVEVEQDEAGALIARNLQCFLAVECLVKMHIRNKRAQHASDEAHDMRIVVHNQRGLGRLGQARQRPSQVFGRDGFGQVVVCPQQQPQVAHGGQRAGDQRGVRRQQIGNGRLRLRPGRVLQNGVGQIVEQGAGCGQVRRQAKLAGREMAAQDTQRTSVFVQHQHLGRCGDLQGAAEAAGGARQAAQVRQRQREMHGGPLAQRAFDPDAPGVQFDKLFADRQPQPAAIAQLGFVQPAERFKGAVQAPRVDAAAAVDHADRDAGGLRMGAGHGAVGSGG